MLTLSSAALEVVAAIAMIILLAQLAGTLPKAVSGAMSSRLADINEYLGLRGLCVVIAALFAIKYAVNCANVILQIRLPLAAGNDLAGRLFHLYLAAPYEFHLRRNSAETLRNLTASVDLLYRIVAPFALSILSEAVAIAAILAVLMFSAPIETFIISIVACTLLFGFYSIFHRRLFAWGQNVQELSREAIIQSRQSLDGIKEIRVFRREDEFWKRYMKVRTALTSVLIKQAQLQQIPRVLLEAFFVGFVLAAIVLFSYRGDRSDILPLLGLFAYAGLRILPSVGRLLVAFQVVRSGGAAAEAVFDDYSTLNTNKTTSRDVSTPRPATANARIDIDRVTFTYSGAAGTAVKDISISIDGGDSVAIVGSSGAGKSTIVNILLGLLRPQSGTIRFGGADIYQDLRCWQSCVGYVPQAVFLLDDTLLRNIAFGIPDQEINEDRARKSLAQAQIDSLLNTLEDGFATRIGEHGARLSGGERQRVAIARALYNEPRIIVFDEATSAVDPVTERLIADAIDRMRGQRTVIVITHRLALARSCKTVVLMSKGQIIDSGSFEYLMKNRPEFRKQVEAERATVSEAIENVSRGD